MGDNVKKPKAAPQRRKTGRPPFAPTPKDVAFAKAMAIAGISQDRIAELIGVAPKTLRKHFRGELDLAIDKANAQVVANLHRQATKDALGATTAAIYWTKARLGWRDTTTADKSNEREGQPFVIRISDDDANL